MAERVIIRVERRDRNNVLLSVTETFIEVPGGSKLARLVDASQRAVARAVGILYEEKG